MPLQALLSAKAFGGEFIANPRTVGSVLPSSRTLGRVMARYVPERPPGLVIELGAGTGAITAGLLKRVPEQNLITVDRSPTMVRRLRRRFPAVEAIVGDAANLTALLEQRFDLEEVQVRHVISSIPLRLLSDEEVGNIASEVRRLLRTGGRFIQFSYDLRLKRHPGLASFRYIRSCVVWMNVPPARVTVYRVPPPEQR